ncbi:MAG: YbhN family protein [Alphaproteobacteria bacterium]
MKRLFDFLWPALGIVAVIFSGWLLYQEVRSLSASDILASLAAIPAHRWFLAGLSTLVAYGALAWYDRIALLHLNRPLGWGFISIVSFTTYALSHNIGASVFSGAAVRYRAYSTKGLTAAEIGVLVALCSFTFMLGTVMLGGIVLIGEPELISRLFDVPVWPGRVLGFVFLGFVALYVLGSLLGFKPLTIGSFHLYYPRPAIVIRQLLAAPLELLGAAGIIYFALPASEGVDFFSVLGAFLGSFSAALLSHAPGGLGVLEFVFLKAMPNIAAADVIAALLVFRLFYLLIPLVFACFVVLVFERKRLLDALRAKAKRS